MLVDSLRLRIAQKVAEQARVGVVTQLEQIVFVELERGRKLSRYLVDTIEPLEKHRAPLVHVIVIGDVAIALRELVAELKPVDLDKDAKAADCPVVWIEQ